MCVCVCLCMSVLGGAVGAHAHVSSPLQTIATNQSDSGCNFQVSVSQAGVELLYVLEEEEWLLWWEFTLCSPLFYFAGCVRWVQMRIRHLRPKKQTISSKSKATPSFIPEHNVLATFVLIESCQKKQKDACSGMLQGAKSSHPLLMAPGYSPSGWVRSWESEVGRANGGETLAPSTSPLLRALRSCRSKSPGGRVPCLLVRTAFQWTRKALGKLRREFNT